MTELQSSYQALLRKAAEDEVFREALIRDPKGTLESYLLNLANPPQMNDELHDDDLASITGGVAAATTMNGSDDDPVTALIEHALAMSRYRLD